MLAWVTLQTGDSQFSNCLGQVAKFSKVSSQIEKIRNHYIEGKSKIECLDQNKGLWLAINHTERRVWRHRTVGRHCCVVELKTMPQSVEEFRKAFNSRLNLLVEKKGATSGFLTRERYDYALNRLKEFKLNSELKKTSQDYRPDCWTNLLSSRQVWTVSPARFLKIAGLTCCT